MPSLLLFVEEDAMRMVLVVCAVLALVCGASWAEGQFKDVPKDHWAAEAVNKLADAGVLKGYPDGTFKGEKTVTRYELAAALSSMVQFIQQSRKPLTQDVKPVGGNSEIATHHDLQTATHHDSKIATHPSQQSWAEASTSFLKSGGYLPPNSPLLKDGNKPITPDDLANALASVATKLIEKDVKEPKAQ